MDACPYCGESLAPGAAQCSRCGMMVDGDEAPAPAPEASAKGGAKGGAAGAAPTAPPAKKKTEPCPRCDKPNPVSAHRCKHCGHALQEIVSAETREAEASFQRTVRLAVAGVVGVIVLGIVVIGLMGTGEQRPKTIEYAKMRFEDLALLVGPSAKGTPQRQKDNWLKYGGKWVSWEGRIVDIEGGGLFSNGALLVRHREGSAGAGEPDVRVSLPKEELAKAGVSAGAKVRYSGRLAGYSTTAGEPTFQVEMGQVLSAKE